MATWTRACATGDIDLEDLIRFDHGGQSFCIYHSPDDTFHATDGHCSHEKVHLCDGLVMDYTVECPKHNGTFDYRTGEAKRAPVCINLKTYPVKVDGGRVYIEVPRGNAKSTLSSAVGLYMLTADGADYAQMKKVAEAFRQRLL